MTNPENNPLDQAMTDRLARLRSMPVEIGPLEAAIQKEIPRHSRRSVFAWFNRPMRLAASILLALSLVITLFVANLPQPVVASPQMLAAMHEQMLSDRDMATPVHSMQAAGASLNQQWPAAPTLPRGNGHEIMACCVHDMGKKKAACVLLKVDDIPVTMALAKASEVRIPPTATMVRNGITYYTQSSDGVNMAMTLRNGQWICLMGRLPVDRLIDTLVTLNP